MVQDRGIWRLKRVLVGKYVDVVVLVVVFSLGCCWVWGVGSLCEALCRCGRCGMGRGKVYQVRGVYVLWLVLYG